MSEDTAQVTLPNGVTFPVTIERDSRCLTHGGQPGWGCDGCRDIVNAIVGFRPVGGWQALHHATINESAPPQPTRPRLPERSVPYTPAVTISEPIYNDQGFSVGFRVLHPPGVVCAFNPTTSQCTCGKLDLGVVSDVSSTEPSPSPS